MKLATFFHDNRTKLGIVEDATIYDASADRACPQDMHSVLEGGAQAVSQLRGAKAGLPRLALSEVILRAPVSRPRKFLGIGLNYHGHRNELAERGAQLPPIGTQIWFNKQVTCLAGPNDPIHMPRVSSALDYEGELACVIGRRCRHIPVADAGQAIFGFMVANDVSVRDWQAASPTGTLGKSFDTHGPCGPWLTTADEIVDPHALTLRTHVDGELRQQGNTGDMIASLVEMIAHLSTVFTLEPGDILCTGTPAGVGQGFDPPRYLRLGQKVRIEIDGLGAIENEVVPEPPGEGFSS
ncbi:MAG: fumarylacetoacetate hydrolase family protein [Candidatus Sphingomonas phytovorans]|nr:fumarylacetoacetate hydrolase family protein [Sphingomonas sp.]WEK02309.1 MAG: fumarylacetoacetate hydrolase family protein [Sphingomonas sp.]